MRIVMKKVIVLAGFAALCSVGKVSTVLAQTCAVPPTCETLGYVKLATQCEGKDSLKCPFDLSKYFCVTVSESGSTGGKTYKVGDAYLNAEGNVIGTVIGITGNGEHGYVLSERRGTFLRTDTPKKAGDFCSGLSEGGLNWQLPEINQVNGIIGNNKDIKLPSNVLGQFAVGSTGFGYTDFVSGDCFINMMSIYQSADYYYAQSTEKRTTTVCKNLSIPIICFAQF